MKNKIIYLLVFLFTVSCNTSLRVEKKRYSPGYYVQNGKVIKVNPKRNKISTADILEKYILINEEKEFSNIKLEEELTLIDDSLLFSVRQINFEKNIYWGNDSCAVIWLKDGGKIDAEVTEVSSKEIKYKKCNKTNSPLYIINNQDVVKIVYPDGDEDYFDSKYDNDENNDNYEAIEENNSNHNNEITPKQIDNNIRIGALIALVLSAIFIPTGVIILWLLSILIGLCICVPGFILLIIGAATIKKKRKSKIKPKPEADYDTIYLIDGKVIKGIIIEKKEGKYVKVQESSGLMNTYKWGDIRQIE